MEIKKIQIYKQKSDNYSYAWRIIYTNGLQEFGVPHGEFKNDSEWITACMKEIKEIVEK